MCPSHKEYSLAGKKSKHICISWKQSGCLCGKAHTQTYTQIADKQTNPHTHTQSRGCINTDTDTHTRRQTNTCIQIQTRQVSHLISKLKCMFVLPIRFVLFVGVHVCVWSCISVCLCGGGWMCLSVLI